MGALYISPPLTRERRLEAATNPGDSLKAARANESEEAEIDAHPGRL